MQRSSHDAETADAQLWREVESIEAKLRNTREGNRVRDVLRQLRDSHLELQLQNRALNAGWEAMEQARDHYVTLYELAPIGYLLLDRCAVVRDLNPCAAQMLAQPHATLLDRPLMPRLAPGSSAAFLAHLGDALNDPVERTVELQLRARHGQSTWISLESVRVQHGTQTLCRSIMTDITERRRLEERLFNGRRCLRRVVDAVPALFMHLDQTLYCHGVNMVCRDWFDIAPQDLVGQHLAAVFDADTLAALAAQIPRALAGEEPAFEGVVRHHRMGCQPTRFTLVPEIATESQANTCFLIGRAGQAEPLAGDAAAMKS